MSKPPNRRTSTLEPEATTSPPAVERADPLSRTMLFALLFGVFTVALGYGFVLPILPFLIERLAGTADPAVVSRHTGLVTGTYVTALFLFAPVWGWLSDRWGRRRVMVLSLVGFGSSLAIFTVFDDLYLLYVGRLLDGLFAAAITPAALAFLGDRAPSDEWRAQRLAWLSMAAIAGFLVGPVLGGMVGRGAETMGLDNIYETPFLAAAAIAYVAAIATASLLPRVASIVPEAQTAANSDLASPIAPAAVIPRLLLISLTVAAGLGAFEVTLALRGKQALGMSPSQVGLMFIECSVVMFIAQAIVFSPLVKAEKTRWLFPPALVFAASGLFALPWTTSFILLPVVVGVVAASAGILLPLATYWVSLAARKAQGQQLGRQAAAAGLGQAAGSVGAGLLFGVAYLPEASVLSAVALLVVVAVSLGLPGLLAPLAARRDRIAAASRPQ